MTVESSYVCRLLSKELRMLAKRSSEDIFFKYQKARPGMEGRATFTLRLSTFDIETYKARKFKFEGTLKYAI